MSITPVWIYDKTHIDTCLDSYRIRAILSDKTLRKYGRERKSGRTRIKEGFKESLGNQNTNLQKSLKTLEKD
jgi:hypothetical protein